MIEVEINKVKRGFKFGTYTFKIITQLTGISDVGQVFGKLEGKDLGFMVTFFLACAKHYSLSMKQEVNYDEMEVGEWIDEIGLPKAEEILTELIQTYTLKNQRAPQEPGQSQ